MVSLGTHDVVVAKKGQCNMTLHPSVSDHHPMEQT